MNFCNCITQMKASMCQKRVNFSSSGSRSAARFFSPPLYWPNEDVSVKKINQQPGSERRAMRRYQKPLHGTAFPFFSSSSSSSTSSRWAQMKKKRNKKIKIKKQIIPRGEERTAKARELERGNRRSREKKMAEFPNLWGNIKWTRQNTFSTESAFRGLLINRI